MAEGYTINMFIINPREGIDHASTRFDRDAPKGVLRLQTSRLHISRDLAFIKTSPGDSPTKTGLMIGSPHRSIGAANAEMRFRHFLPDSGLGIAFATNLREGLIAVVRRT